MVRVAVWWSARLGSGAEGVAGVECDVRRRGWRRAGCGARRRQAGALSTPSAAAQPAPRHAAHFTPHRHKHSIAKRTTVSTIFLDPVHTKP